MASAREILAKLRSECETLADTLRHQGLATDPVLAAQRPGGPENPDRGVFGYLSYYRWLHRTQAAGIAGGTSDHPRRPDLDDAVAFEAVSSVPMRVTLVSPVPDGDATRDYVLVYPKGLNALILCHDLNLRLGLLSVHLEATKEISTPDELEIQLRAWARVNRYLQRLAWIVTTEGPGRPYDPLKIPDPDPPEWVGHLSAIDLSSIHQAYQQVNALRLLAIDRMVMPDAEGHSQRPSWSIFAADAAAQLGITEASLREDRDLPSIVAGQRLRYESQRRAQTAAESRARSRRPATRS